MQGRKEVDRSYERRITNRLKAEPKVVRDYMRSISALTATTRHSYLGYVSNFVAFLEENNGISGANYKGFADIKKLDIDAYMESIKYNAKTGEEASASIRNAKLSAVNSFFEFLIDNEIITKNPCAAVKKVKEHKEKSVTYLTKDEVDGIKKAILDTPRRGGNFCDPWRFRDYAIFVLGCTTGLRNAAIREINVEDLDLENRQVTVTEKNNTTKVVYLSGETCDALEQWLTERKKILKRKNTRCDAVFISSQLKRISAVALGDVLKKYAGVNGKHITPHKMRSTCAMNLYEATGDIYMVAQQLGHKSIRNTQIYAKATKEQMRNTANLMDRIYSK